MKEALSPGEDFERKKLANEYLDHLRKVGPDKPLGYLPLETIIKDCGISVDDLKEELEEKGLRTKIFLEGRVAGGALYAYDEQTLRQLLSKNRNILKGRLPIEPSQFVDFIATNYITPYTKLFDIVADAFGDKINPERTDSSF
jgi:hypothetical protein